MIKTPVSSHWQPARTGTGFVEGLADIQQCVSNILETPLGSNPIRPDFGSRIHEYLDWPINEARPHIVRESVEAIRRWEKRLTVTRVQVFNELAQTIIRVYFKLADGLERFIEVRP